MKRFAALILAAGRSSRFATADGSSKLLAPWQGEPIIRHVARLALMSAAFPVVVVTGHARGEVEAALEGLQLRFVFNQNFGEGLSSSLRAGVASLPHDIDGALALLGDMPTVREATLGALLDAGGNAPPSCRAVLPTFQGRVGNPALLMRAVFPSLDAIEGDEGARRLLTQRGDVQRVEVDDKGVLIDIDSWEDFLAIGAEGCA